MRSTERIKPSANENPGAPHLARSRSLCPAWDAGLAALRRSCFAAPALLLCIPFSAIAQQNAPPSAPKPELPAIPAPPANLQAAQPRYSVALDAAHGGADTGARIGDHALEKDLTLAFSVRLRSALASRGIEVATTRESDSAMPAPTRAGVVNHALAAACIVLHATATGTGVHLFTSSLAPAAANRMQPWQTAQAPFIAQSLRLSSELNSALGQAGIPVTLGRTSLQPLDSLACPAVAVEVAPLTASSANKPLLLTDAGYQKRILDALTAALVEWRGDWKQQP